MLTRLLIVLLVLVGQSPARSCTCAAPPSQPSSLFAANPTAESLSDFGGCSCHHKKRKADSAHSVSHDRDCQVAATGESHPHQRDHERDCPAVNAPAVWSAIASPLTVPALEDGGLAFPCPLQQLTDEPADGFALSFSTHLGRSDGTATPLYLRLRTLRN